MLLAQIQDPFQFYNCIIWNRLQKVKTNQQPKKDSLHTLCFVINALFSQNYKKKKNEIFAKNYMMLNSCTNLFLRFLIRRP